MLAVKIFPDSPKEVTEAALDVVENNPGKCGLELGLYGEIIDFPSKEIDERIIAIPDSDKVLHSYLFEVGLDQITCGNPKTLEVLAREAEISRRFGISSSVVHAYRQVGGGIVPMSSYPAPKEAALLWGKALAYMSDLGMRPLFEKTFETVEWFDETFDILYQDGLAEKAGFCLDIGHARVWERVQLERWLEFTKKIRDRGFAVHFHIHGNDGLDDLHIPLHLAAERGMLSPADDYAPRGVLPWLKEAMEEHPDSLFTLENQTKYAKDVFEFTTSAVS